MNYLSKCDPINGCGKCYPADLNNCPHCGADHAFSSPAPVDPRDWGYDEETFPNIFTCCFIHAATGMEFMYEISDRRNDWQALVDMVHNLGRSGARGIGFNNLEFDYPIMHWLVQQHAGISPQQIFAKAQQVIESNNENSWANMVWDREQVFQQIDLYKINHFDNKARRTSLKALEVGMRSRNIKDLPFPVGATLDHAQKDVLIEYNKHDVRETLKFYVRCLDKIKFREELTTTYGKNFMNHPDTKIGKDIFVNELEKAGVRCSGATIRERIELADCIPSYIEFTRPEFNEILERMRGVVLSKKQQDELLTTKGVFNDMNVTVDGVEYSFGLGGIHSGIPNCVFHSSQEFLLKNKDVTSMYPSISIKNRYYPEHLGETFCDVYEQLFFKRRDAKRAGDKVVDATLKLALNGTFGNMGSKYSPFCDHKCLLSITITGQLCLAMLVDRLLTQVPDVVIPQSNTDGAVIYYPAIYDNLVEAISAQWEKDTMLGLETDIVKSLYQRDVNNYIMTVD